MQKVIEFFIKNTRLNYTLMVLLIIAGVYAYNTIPKEVFPKIQLKQILIDGSYAGASADTMNRVVVSKLESKVNGLNGVKKIESFITNGSFSMLLTLEESSNEMEVLNKSKDIISNNRSNFPSDMDEPIATLVEDSFPLINITVSSQTKSKDELIRLAKVLKNKLQTIKNVSKVRLNEDPDFNYEIILNTQALDMYKLDKNALSQALANISYIFPLGKVEDKNAHFFLSTYNGAKDIDSFLNTLIKVGEQSFYLRDIATVKSKYKDTDIISTFNGQKNVSLAVEKNKYANVIALTKTIKEEVAKLNDTYAEYEIDTFYDTSVLIKNRLNTVVSSIFFGLFLVGLSLYILVNKRAAFVVVLGIPTALLIGVVVLYALDFGINMVTLLGVLLILGVLVDDAIIVAENIQRHLQEGANSMQAAVNGTKEVLTPVLASSLTSIFAFLPMLIMTGEVGEFMKYIPIAIIILIIASLIESFVFLPLHAKHILHAGDKELDWSKAIKLYQNILIKTLKYKKTFLITFVVLVPTLTVFLFSSMRYQFFPEFDASRVFIKGKFSMDHRVNEVYQKLEPLRKELLAKKEELFIKSIDFSAGYRTDDMMQAEVKSNVFMFNIELNDRAPQNFVDAYLTPILSFDFDTSHKTRTKDMNQVVLEISKLIEPYQNTQGLKELKASAEGAGISNNDIEILLNTPNRALLDSAIATLTKALSNTKGVISANNDAKYGIKELKLRINNFGESLGLSEAYVASELAPFYLESERAKALNDEGIVEITTYAEQKNTLEDLKSFELNLPSSTQKVLLNEVADFIYIRNFDSLYKKNGANAKTVFANVNTKEATATEVLDSLEPLLTQLEEQGVEVSFAGEQEVNEQIGKEFSRAFFIAIALIFITLLVMFNSFRHTFTILSIIPFSLLGAVIGHLIMDVNFTFPSMIGMLGLAGVVINDGIVMLDFIRRCESVEELLKRAASRLRPILITSITTFVGLSTLIFFATGQALILQPIAISLGFGLIWGTILTLLYIPILFALTHKLHKRSHA